VSEAGIFAVGVAVTLLVAAAIALLVYGAVLDGRTAREMRAQGSTGVPEPPVTAPPARTERTDVRPAGIPSPRERMPVG